MDAEMDLVYRVLDDQLVDVDGVRCGRVDDIEFEGEPGGRLVVTAILTGHGTWADRVPRRFRSLARRLFGEDVRGRTVRRVPWEDVEEVTARVALRRRASDMQLDVGEEAARRWIEKLPGA
jgi:sporulation protein YlmC with PRC-barrel domain